jgi:transcriptional regulator with XRE-family HTH domain
MDHRRLGAALRAARIQRQLRQVDVARLAKTSDTTISRVERGHAEGVTLATLDAIARALEVSIQHRAWAPGGELDRLLDAAHAALVDAVVAHLSRLGWVCRPEASFNIWGERGSIDVLAWQPAYEALLVVEVKTTIVDVGELLGTLDRKRRLALTVGRTFGWDARSVAVALVVRQGRTNRRRITEHRATVRSAFPASAANLRAYLRRPAAAISVLVMWPDSRGTAIRPGVRAIRRVRTTARAPSSRSASTK